MGDLVGHAAVDLVADPGEDGDRQGGDLPGDGLAVEHCEVRPRPAAPNERHDVRCQRDRPTKGRHERRPGVDALHPRVDHMDRPAEAAGFELVEEVGARRARDARHERHPERHLGQREAGVSVHQAFCSQGGEHPLTLVGQPPERVVGVDRRHPEPELAGPSPELEVAPDAHVEPVLHAEGLVAPELGVDRPAVLLPEHDADPGDGSVAVGRRLDQIEVQGAARGAVRVQRLDLAPQPHLVLERPVDDGADALGQLGDGERRCGVEQPVFHRSGGYEGGLAYSAPMHTVIGPGVTQIDTLLGGWERVTAGYLVDGDEPALIETGSRTSVDALLSALDGLGVAAADLASIAVTHIHLDHAGGVGDVARAFPNATVYVHEKGARHLVDPGRLISSAAQVYGDLLDSSTGRLDPGRHASTVLYDGDELRRLPEPSTGHGGLARARQHHLALHDPESGILFAGDAVGVRLPDVGVLRPSTPPPDFDLDQALHSIEPVRLPPPVGHRAGPLRSGDRRPGRPRRGQRDPAEVGRASPSRRGPRGATSPPRSTRRSGSLDGVDPPTGRSSRRSTASTPTPPASAAGSTNGPRRTGTATDACAWRCSGSTRDRWRCARRSRRTGTSSPGRGQPRRPPRRCPPGCPPLAGDGRAAAPAHVPERLAVVVAHRRGHGGRGRGPVACGGPVSLRAGHPRR